MFKDSNVVRMDAWSIVEKADAMPAVSYPLFVGTGKLGVGLDACGLQSLPDTLGEHYNCPVKPFHTTQADLYVLREGMISAHLWDDEIQHTGTAPTPPNDRRVNMRNFMPMGYISQEFEFDGLEMDGLSSRDKHFVVRGDDIRRHARFWRRDWDLRHGIATTSFDIHTRPFFTLTVQVFAPYGGQSVYIRLTRSAWAGRQGSFKWTVSLPLETRHGLPLFDQADQVHAGRRTILAGIDEKSRYTPAEPYTVLYGVGADGMETAVSAHGWSATMTGPIGREQSAWLRLDFHRFAGDERSGAPAAAQRLEGDLADFSRGRYEQAIAAHRKDWEDFWARTADIEIENEDRSPQDLRRRYLLHVSQYLFRCGNDHALGGTVQFLLLHQNGWRACSFHDQHYLIDGMARSNMWPQAMGNLHWMRRVMRPAGRPFPWMMTYDGYPPVPPEADRAPMSDANRALLAMRLYELAGAGRGQLLRETVYPIVRAVAEHGVKEWFYSENGRMLFRAVETDVMNDTPRPSEAGTVAMYLTVLRKAAQYARLLGVDGDRAEAWEAVANQVAFPVVDGLYEAWHGAGPKAGVSCWFFNSFYISEAQEYLDPATYRRTRDRWDRAATINMVWMDGSAASSEIRLGRSDRAEQFMVDALENGIHGPGYFEECTPNGWSSFPPFATAHGAYLTACCEQVVLPDFWRPKVSVGVGLPSRLLAAGVRFVNLRGPGGVMLSGRMRPGRLEVQLHHTGEAMALEVVLRIPCGVGTHFDVLRDGQPADYDFHGETVNLQLALQPDQRTQLEIVPRT